MSVELEIKIPKQTTTLDIENCVRGGVGRLFGDDESRLLSFDVQAESIENLSDMVVRLANVASVSIGFFEFDDAESAESGTWCTLSANLDRSQTTYALMCVIAGALAIRFNTPVVDDALWLGEAREISAAELESRIRGHADVSLQTASAAICRALGIG